MAALTRDQILAARDLGVTEMEIPEWGGSVFLRKLAARDLLKMRARSKSGGEFSVAEYAAMGIADANGQPLFPKAKDVEALGEKAFDVLNRIIERLNEINGFNDAAEDAEKN